MKSSDWLTKGLPFGLAAVTLSLIADDEIAGKASSKRSVRVTVSDPAKLKLWLPMIRELSEKSRVCRIGFGSRLRRRISTRTCRPLGRSAVSFSTLIPATVI